MTEKRPRSFAKKALLLLGGLVIALLLFIAALPTLVGWGLGQGMIRAKISEHVNGDVSWTSLSVGWFSGARVREFAIRTDDDTRFECSITTRKGLLGLLFGNLDFGVIDLEGRITGVRRADGTTTVGEIARPGREPAGPSSPAPASKPADPLPTSLAATINVSRFIVAIKDEKTGETLGLDDFSGTAAFSITRPVSLDFTGTTRAGAATGSLHVRGTITDLFSADGHLTPEAVRADLKAELKHVSLAMLDALLGLDDRAASITGDMLREAVITVDGGTQRGALTLAVDADRLKIDGVVAFADGAATIRADAPFIVRLQPTAAVTEAYLRELDSAALGFETRPTIVATERAQVTFELSSLHLALPTAAAPLDLRGARLHAQVRAGDFGLRLARAGANQPEEITLERFALDVLSEDLTGDVAVNLDLLTLLNGAPAGTIAGSLHGRGLLTADGTPVPDPARMTASLEAKNVPTSLAQLFIHDLPIDLREDIGPSIDCTIAIGPGEAKELAFTFTADRLRADFRAEHDPAVGLTGRPGVVTFDINDKLITAFAADRVRVPGRLTFALESFSVPMKPAAQGLDFDHARARGRLALSGVAVGPTGPAPEIRSFDVGFTAETDAGVPALRLQGEAMIEDATITLSQLLRRATPARPGAPFLATLRPEGVITLRLPTTRMLELLAPEPASIVQSVLAGAMTTTITTTPSKDGFDTRLALESPGVNTSFALRIDSKAIMLEPSSADVHLTPALVEALLGPAVIDDTGRPVERMTLTHPGTLSLRALTAAIPFNAEGAPDLDAAAFDGAIVLAGSPVLKLNREAAGIRFAEFGSDLSGSLGATPRLNVKGRAFVDLDNGDELSRVTFDIDINREAPDATLEPVIELDVSSLSLLALEKALGRDTGTLSAWIGARGQLRASILPRGDLLDAAVDLDFPFVSGAYRAVRDASRITLTADKPRLVLASAALEQLLNPPPSEDDAPPLVPLKVAGDVPIAISIRRFVLPRALLEGTPMDPALARVDVELRAESPLILIEPDGARRELRDLVFTLGTTNLAGRVSFAINGRAVAEPDQPGELAVTGGFRRLMSAENTFTTETAVLDLDAQARAIPTVILDAIQGWNGLIAAALGDTVDATIKTTAFSPRTGNLDARLSTPTSSLNVNLLGRRDSLLSANEDNKVQGSFALSPAFRQELLRRIHPVLADIRTVENPITIDVTNVVIPLDGDLARLRSDLTLVIGAIELDKGTSILRLLSFIESSPTTVVPGSFEPIHVRIRDGVLTYDRFALTIGGLTLAYNGRVDLVNRTVDIFTELPLDAMTLGIRELKGKVGTIPVRLRTHGSFDALKTEPAPLDQARQQQLLAILAETAAARLLPETKRDDPRTQQLIQIAALALEGASTMLADDKDNQVGSLLNMNKETLNRELSKQIQAMLLRELGFDSPGGLLDDLLRGRQQTP